MRTESRDTGSGDIDIRPTADAVRILWSGQWRAVGAVEAALEEVARAVDAAAKVLAGHGRLVHVGAGTSARIAVQDGAELLPTFGWPRERIAFAIAGGAAALDQSVEDAEDDARAGCSEILRLGIGPEDVVVGTSASGTTPFTVAAVRQAHECGALTIGIANNPDSPLLRAAAFRIFADTGSEAIAGSTRLNAGTAQKVILNLLSTGIMIRLGRVYGGLMIGMQPTNQKLRRRAIRIVSSIAGCGESAAEEALAGSDGDIRLACLLAAGVDIERARHMLDECSGDLRKARRLLGLETE
ncbi:MAG: N-acetylmuramic acid 6-phosphate etherase [Rhodospirillales bacterium]|nr:N-acetylmuramic acid 6-phosphate etherase [Rhodospirillales bacterium]